jgi:hypothetical protein
MAEPEISRAFNCDFKFPDLAAVVYGKGPGGDSEAADGLVWYVPSESP